MGSKREDLREAISEKLTPVEDAEEVDEREIEGDALEEDNSGSWFFRAFSTMAVETAAILAELLLRFPGAFIAWYCCWVVVAKVEGKGCITDIDGMPGLVEPLPSIRFFTNISSSLTRDFKYSMYSWDLVRTSKTEALATFEMEGIERRKASMRSFCWTRRCLSRMLWLVRLFLPAATEAEDDTFPWSEDSRKCAC